MLRDARSLLENAARRLALAASVHSHNVHQSLHRVNEHLSENLQLKMIPLFSRVSVRLKRSFTMDQPHPSFLRGTLFPAWQSRHSRGEFCCIVSYGLRHPQKLIAPRAIAGCLSSK